ncbi:MAG: mechanosensitive ion channel family protein [Spirochaetales bacterium]
MLLSLINDLGPNVRSLAVLGGAVVLGILLALAIIAMAVSIAKRRESPIATRIGPVLRLPVVLFLPAIMLAIAIPFATLPEDAARTAGAVARVLVMAFGAFLITRGLVLVEDIAVLQYPTDVENNLKARKVHTQIRYIRRIASFLIFVLALGAILLTFEGIRQVGTTLLTTAGVAGIIVGFAAQQTLGLVFAGLLIAFTQPIRLGDAVVIEGEWGWVEEITLTYVVIKIWDWRRLIVPITYFLDNNIQNWTRTSSRLIGSIYLYIDYGFPIQEIREALDRVLKKTDLWDGGVSVVQVTDVTEKSAQVRVLVTAKDSPRLWDLRCLVREQLISYVQQEHPEMMPRFRAIVGEQEMQDVAALPSTSQAAVSTEEPIGPGEGASAASGEGRAGEG